MSVLRWITGVAFAACCALPAMAQSPIQTTLTYPAAFTYGFQDEAVATDAAPAADCGCACEPSCGCEDGCCSSCGGSSLFDCCLGDAWTLQDYLQPCCDQTVTYGGWFSMGYYNENERLSFDEGDELSFNDNPDEINFDQVWFYVEKLAEADCCSADWGYRYDIMYGAQAHTAQAFGNEDNVWDVSFDHGIYGWAMPQAYVEYAKGDWSVKAGHFWTPAGYEVVPATGNFFYSHSLTHYNSEPFTHTGVLGAYSASDCMTYYAGWTLGWDTGFDQFDGGNNFVGGFTYDANRDVTFTYISTVGNLGWKSGGEFGHSHHLVGVATLSPCWTWVVQSDLLFTNGTLNDDDFENEDKGVTNYLYYTLNDCWSVGGRAEWWKTNLLTGESASLYEITGGINYQAHANLVVRPEVRYDWTPSEEAIDDDYNQWVFSIDAVMTY